MNAVNFSYFLIFSEFDFIDSTQKALKLLQFRTAVS